MLSNPFTYGYPISDPRRFVGQAREVEQIFGRLRSQEFESSSLVGIEPGFPGAEVTHCLAPRFGLPTGEPDLILRLLRRKLPGIDGHIST
jgi:hypothetical protein